MLISDLRPDAIALVPALLLLAPAASAQDHQDSGGVLDPERACYDVLRYDLTLSLDVDARTIDGSNVITFWLEFPSDDLRIDLDRHFEVDHLLLDGERIRFKRTDDEILVDSSKLESGKRYAIEVFYRGEPRQVKRFEAPWQGGFVWETTLSGAPWIATACQGEGADLWWPCKDHPSDEADSMGIAVTVPEPLVVATNGAPVGEIHNEEDGTATWLWQVTTPINNYGVALNIAPYVALEHDYVSVTGERFPFTYWCLPENEAKGRAILPEFAEHMRHLEETCGPYPFRGDKYGVVETPHLGMEHQSIIAYGNQYRGDRDFGYDWLHHHELAHEWWANLVTARDWSDFWIHEGIGTYVQALYLEQKFGPDAYRKKMANDRRRIGHTGPVAPRGARSAGWMYLSDIGKGAPGVDIYMKGSWVCHELRWLLGDEAFFRVLRRWAYPDPALEAVTDGSACRLTDTDELLAIAERESGTQLAWYFEVALRRAQPPQLQVERRGDSLRLSWKAPDDLPYPMPVEVAFGEQRMRLAVPEGGAEYPVVAEPVVIDPDDWLLGAE
ncbi:MAG: M1 family metallopeptidase [Planctomycetota bacterium]